MSVFFPHEGSKAYQLTLEWSIWLQEFLKQASQRTHIHGELDRLSTTIAVGVAEAAGKGQTNDRVSALEAAKSGVLTSAALIDIMGIKNLAEQGDMAAAKRQLSQIYRLLSGMILSTNTNEFIRSRLAVPD